MPLADQAGEPGFAYDSYDLIRAAERSRGVNDVPQEDRESSAESGLRFKERMMAPNGSQPVFQLISVLICEWAAASNQL